MVFIGGSRKIGRLSASVRDRVDRIIEKGLPVVVGDANGADKAVQAYLHARRYSRVEVFSSTDVPRNNLGGWGVRVVAPPHTRRDFDFYATKDRAMASAASVGLMIWDGHSRGTLMNALRLVAQGKPAVVYVRPRQEFVELRSAEAVEDLAKTLDAEALRRLRQQADREGLERRPPEPVQAALPL